MRLENKMNKWLKFIIKLLPFFWVLIFLFFSIGSSSDSGGFISEFYNFLVSEDITNVVQYLFNDIDFSTPFYPFLEIVYVMFDGINDFILKDFLGLPLGEGGCFVTILCLFEYWLIIDLVDLIFSAFRFIIDIAHSWLDGFYTRSKRGGK